MNHPAHQPSDRSARLDTLTLDDWARVNIVGSSGSGKSTLRQKLADKLGHPPIEIDALFWGPNWTEPVDTEFMAKLEKALEPTTWVLDGNYDRTRAIKWPRATIVIWLDLPYWQVLWQVFTRTMKRSLTRETLWSGNQESCRKHFFLETLFCSGQSPILAISASATSVPCSRPITHTFTGSAFARVVIFSVCSPMLKQWVTARPPAVWLIHEFSGKGPRETADSDGRYAMLGRD